MDRECLGVMLSAASNLGATLGMDCDIFEVHHSPGVHAQAFMLGACAPSTLSTRMRMAAQECIHEAGS